MTRPGIWAPAVAVLLALAALPGCERDAQKLARGECPAVLPRWTVPRDGKSAFRPINFVAFEGAQLTWNRQPITRTRLRTYLALTRGLNPVPFTVLDATGAPDCATAASVRDEIDRGADCRGEGVCGQGSREEWRNAPGLSGPWGVE